MISLACNIYCVGQTTTLAVCGTSLSLRGPDGSMIRAVDGMYVTSRRPLTGFPVSTHRISNFQSPPATATQSHSQSYSSTLPKHTHTSCRYAERLQVFRSFAIGLFTLLLGIMFASWIVMDVEAALASSCIIT